MIKSKAVTILKFVILIGILAGIPAYIVLFHRDLISEFENYQDIVSFLRSNPTESIIAYLLAQIIQIVVCILPGQVFQFAAGAVFGFFPGLILSVIGAALGTTVVYYLARLLGKDAMVLFFGEEKMSQYINYLNSEKAYILIFLIYLIPGLPKDLVCYAAGMSDVKYRPFLILSTTGRIPAMCGSLLFGHMLIQGNYTGMAILAAFVGIAAIICFIFKNRVKSTIDYIYKKLS